MPSAMCYKDGTTVQYELEVIYSTSEQLEL